MKKFQINARDTGTHLGTYEAADADGAIAAYCRNIGGSSVAQTAASMGVTVEAFCAEISVAEVSEPVSVHFSRKKALSRLPLKSLGAELRNLLQAPLLAMEDAAETGKVDEDAMEDGIASLKKAVLVIEQHLGEY